MTTPKTKKEFEALKKMTAAELKKNKLAIFEKGKDNALWLFPKEFYNNIPDGFEVITINGKKEKFKKGKSDDDRVVSKVESRRERRPLGRDPRLSLRMVLEPVLAPNLW